jgi:hypothetical protein
METTLGKLSRKFDTPAAIRYALSRWRALTRYADNGYLEIDNNAAERSLRVLALGRKNFLFCGSDAGGKRAAVIYSCSVRPSSTASIRRYISSTSSHTSQTNRSTASIGCSHGTYRLLPPIHPTHK